MTTDRLMLDVSRSSSTTPGELCVVTSLTKQMHKWPVICSDLGDFALFLHCLIFFQIILYTHFVIIILNNILP